MIKAVYKDKKSVIDILTGSFAENKSVNYILKQDTKKEQRLKLLMEYSFEVCYLFGDIFLSPDKNSCALIMYPEKKKTTFKSVLLDAKLIVYAIGIGNIMKAMKRETKIKQQHPKGRLCYLWFIGTKTEKQNNGIGSRLLEDIITESKFQERIICLETSTLKNIPWYEKSGFEIYNELDFGYKLFCMKL